MTFDRSVVLTKYHAELREKKKNDPQPDKKRCSKCEKWKDLGTPGEGDGDFPWQRRKYKDGTSSMYPNSWCRRCQADNYKLRMKKDPEKELKLRRDRQKRQRQDPEWVKHHRSKQREYDRRRTLAQGKKLRPTKKYRHEVYGEEVAPHSIRVPIEPLLEWMENLYEYPTHERMGKHSRIISSALIGDRKTFSIETVDEIGLICGQPGLLAILYPEL